jgi:hypothetical protein
MHSLNTIKRINREAAINSPELLRKQRDIALYEAAQREDQAAEWANEVDTAQKRELRAINEAKALRNQVEQLKAEVRYWSAKAKTKTKSIA